MTFRLGIAALCITPMVAVASQQVPGVTFAGSPQSLYVSARSVADALNVPLEYDPRSDLAFLGSIPLDYESAVGDQRFVSVDALRTLGAKLVAQKGGVSVHLNGHEMDVRSGRKIAVVDKVHQQMRVYSGKELVLTTRISTGKYARSTPDGVFHVGRVKDAFHASSKYGDAPMPWAVHVIRNIYIHGGVVPDHPASHGCVRLPNDAARWFYNWAEPGTVVRITG